jgi:hypothetical protein
MFYPPSVHSIVNKDPVEKEEEEWIITEATEECDEIQPNESTVIKRVITVPKLQPTIDNCDLIQVCYRIWIRVKTNEIGKRETLIIPLTIGTIGFKNENEPPAGDEMIKSLAKKKANLTLNFDSINNNSSTEVCTCTCSCSHCGKVKLITESDLSSPDSTLSPDTPMIPETPMTPTTPGASAVFLSFSAAAAANDDEVVEGAK